MVLGRGRGELPGSIIGMLERKKVVLPPGRVQEPQSTRPINANGGTDMASETEQELRRHLEGIDFAANTEDLIAMAMHNGAPEDFIEELEELPRQEFEDLEEVAEAIKDLRADG
jgi:hypothetical protein